MEDIFLVVKAYPTISRTHHEACCMAGITRDGKWIRLYPVYFRQLEDEQRFAKYTWIRARIRKAKDFRNESHYIESESIEVLENVPPSANWRKRAALLAPLLRDAGEVFREDRPNNVDTLAFIRPKRLIDLEISDVPDEDFQRQVANLKAHEDQLSLIPARDVRPLDLIPYTFRYHFEDDAGKEHRIKIVDWEIYQLYRHVRHRKDWRGLISAKYLADFSAKDLHLFVGTMHVYPRSWLIIGVYYPPMPVPQGDSAQQLPLDIA